MSRIDKAIELAARINQSEQILPESEIEVPGIQPAACVSLSLKQLKDPKLATINEPNGVVAEEYNKFRTIILRLANSEPRKSTFLVTSAVPNEGKTLTAANLALSMARSTDYPIFLADADFRKPSIHELFGLDLGPGLAQCLRENLSFGEALVRTDLGNLAILPAGLKSEDPLEWLSSQRIQRFIHAIKKDHPESYVIFDSPPVLPFADARVLGPLVDGTIFVTRENISKLKQVQLGLESLSETHILGVLCNETASATGQEYGNYY